MKDEMFLTLKNHKERMDFIVNSDNWGVLSGSDLFEIRYLFIGTQSFVRILAHEQEFPTYANNSADLKANPPKWVRLDQFEIRYGSEEHPEYLVRVTNTELCDVLAKYQRKLRKEMQQ